VAGAFVTQGERETTLLKRTAATACVATVLLGTLVLMAWMLARVAEHPGVPREISELPSWFTGAVPVPGARQRSPASAPAAGAAVLEAYSPAIEAESVFAFDNLDKFEEEGYKAASLVVPSLQTLLAAP